MNKFEVCEDTESGRLIQNTFDKVCLHWATQGTYPLKQSHEECAHFIMKMIIKTLNSSPQVDVFQNLTAKPCSCSLKL